MVLSAKIPRHPAALAVAEIQVLKVFVITCSKNRNLSSCFQCSSCVYVTSVDILMLFYTVL